MTALFLTRNGTLRPNRRPKAYAAKHAQLAKEVRREQPERAFQKLLVQHLRLALPPDVFMTAFPAGGGGKVRGAQLKAMGLVAGVPDLMFLYKGETHFMELKAPNGKVSPAQVDCQQALFRAGAGTAIVRTLAEAYRALDAWQIPTRLVKPQPTAQREAA